MQPVKAVRAREINKSDITEAEALVFEGRILKQTGKQSMEPGEFYFRPIALPVTTKPGFWARLFGVRPKQGWKMVQTVVIACPFCSRSIMTSTGHKIEHRAPLTIAGEITCPYAPEAPHSFKVEWGEIIAV